MYYKSLSLYNSKVSSFQTDSALSEIVKAQIMGRISCNFCFFFQILLTNISHSIYLYWIVLNNHFPATFCLNLPPTKPSLFFNGGRAGWKSFPPKMQGLQCCSFYHWLGDVGRSFLENSSRRETWDFFYRKKTHPIGSFYSTPPVTVFK